MIREEPPFPEREHYGCVNCGSTNHTTGDKNWCPVEHSVSDELQRQREDRDWFDQFIERMRNRNPLERLYRKCDDGNCPVAYAYGDGEHWHWKGVGDETERENDSESGE